MTEVQISSIKDLHGIAIGQESLFLYVEEENGGYKFKLQDLFTPQTHTTSWVTLDSPEKLPNSPKAKFIRNGIKTRCGSGWEKTLDRMICLIQDNGDRWKNEEPQQEDPKNVINPELKFNRERNELTDSMYAGQKKPAERESKKTNKRRSAK